MAYLLVAVLASQEQFIVSIYNGSRFQVLDLNNENANVWNNDDKVGEAVTKLWLRIDNAFIIKLLQNIRYSLLSRRSFLVTNRPNKDRHRSLLDNIAPLHAR